MNWWFHVHLKKSCASPTSVEWQIHAYNDFLFLKNILELQLTPRIKSEYKSNVTDCSDVRLHRIYVKPWILLCRGKTCISYANGGRWPFEAIQHHFQPKYELYVAFNGMVLYPLSSVHVQWIEWMCITIIKKCIHLERSNYNSI